MNQIKNKVLFISTVFCVVLLALALPAAVFLGVIQYDAVGLNEVLLLFEIDLQNSLHHHKGDATLEETKQRREDKESAQLHS